MEKSAKIIAITIVATCMLFSCSKTEFSPSESHETTAKTISLDYTLKWSVDNVDYLCYGDLESNSFSVYIDTHQIAKYNYLDNLAVGKEPISGGYILQYESLDLDGLEFSITDIDVDGDEISFNFRANGDILNSFTMTGSTGFVATVLNNLQEPDPGNPSISRTNAPRAPYFQFFPDGTAKLLLDCSLYRFDASDDDPFYYENAFQCHWAMSRHYAFCHYGYSHNVAHLIPTHGECLLTCNGNTVVLH